MGEKAEVNPPAPRSNLFWVEWLSAKILHPWVYLSLNRFNQNFISWKFEIIDLFLQSFLRTTFFLFATAGCMTNIVLGYVNHQLEWHKKKLFLSFFCITVVCHNSWLIYSQGEKRNRTTGTVSVSLITSVLQWELCEVRSRKGPNQSTKKSWWVTDDAGSLRLSGAEGATAADWGQAAVWEVWKVGLFCFWLSNS